MHIALTYSQCKLQNCEISIIDLKMFRTFLSLRTVLASVQGQGLGPWPWPWRKGQGQDLQMVSLRTIDPKARPRGQQECVRIKIFSVCGLDFITCNTADSWQLCIVSVVFRNMLKCCFIHLLIWYIIIDQFQAIISPVSCVICLFVCLEHGSRYSLCLHLSMTHTRPREPLGATADADISWCILAGCYGKECMIWRCGLVLRQMVAFQVQLLERQVVS